MTGTSAIVVHQAGPVRGGVQACLRCGAPLAGPGVRFADGRPAAVAGFVGRWLEEDLLVAIPADQGAYPIARRLPMAHEVFCAPVAVPS